MVDTVPEKHFLDTSVVRPILLGSAPYRRYFEDQFRDNPLYISKYVQMEFKRSYLCPILDFYFVLHMPAVETVGDAFQIWSNRFKSSELKAILQLVGQLIDDRSLDLSDPRDKKKALRAVGFYAKRVEMKLRRSFKDIGSNSTRCARSKVSFSIRDMSELTRILRSFLEQFNDVETCRSRCIVDDFILKRYRSQVEGYVEQASGLSKLRSQENKGFTRIAQNLEKILHNGPDICSCHRCKAIGDAVIALETPREMRLEHTDHYAGASRLRNGAVDCHPLLMGVSRRITTLAPSGPAFSATSSIRKKER